MRPHRLTLSAFGPFPGQVDVDLDRLSAGGLFLLQGQTGAGKTTLLDAMCFALYGRVPGSRGVTRLRSDHAPAGAPCSATLEVTVAGRRLRVTRTPSFTRPKKRGSGEVEEKPTARLEELVGGAWRTVSTRHDEVGAELEQLLGMSAEQFWQVVLLPQGQFAEFLRAGAKERGALLETLFRTDRFRDAETWLAEQRRTVRERFETAAGEARSLVARVAEAAQADEPDTDPDVGWYDDLLARAEATVTAATADAVAADAAAARTATLLREAERLDERQRRRRDAERTAAELARAAPDVDAARALVAAARRAAPLRPLADRAAALAAQREQAAADAGRLGAVVGAGPDDDLAALAGQARARTGRLEALRATDARLAATRAQLDDTARALGQLADQLAATAAGRASLPEQVDEATARRDEARAAAAELPAARAAAERLAEVGADASAAAQTRTRLDTEQRAEQDARRLSLAAREERLRVAEALLAGQVARLARDLVDGQPCAVCGSAEHPHPAADSDLVEESALSAAEAEAQRAADAHRRAASAAAATAAELAAVEARLAAAGWTDLTTLDEARAAAAAHVEELGHTAAGLASAEETLAALADRARALAEAAADQEAQRAALDSTRSALAASADEDAAVLAAALGGAPDVETALTTTATLASALEAAHGARTEAARLTREAGAEAERLTAALHEAGFDSLDELRTDLDPGLPERIEAHDAAAATATALLADPDLDVALEPAADVASAAADDVQAREARDAAREHAAVATAQLRAVAAHGPPLRRALAALAPLRAELDEVEHLAELAAGRGSGNRLGMALSTYVLAARLEEVAAAASERLARMSDGRYTLRHTDTRGDARRRGGLGLAVHDAWTGQSRDTGTLSGGETFMASLALALGLADTVTAESGGAPIEALFVDEGFGTLDEDSLEEVMDVLDGLRAGGRVVGVVSHVADLRQRIPTQVQVRKGRSGSTLAVVA